MKPQDHVKITRKAIEIYHRYAQSDFSQLLFENSSKVERGSDLEDLFPLHARISNWHFFKQNTILRPTTVYYLPIIPTSEVVLQRRIDKLKSVLELDSPARIGKLIGRVLHHIQDMSTPAHVVPVYHGLKQHDSFEDYSYLKGKHDRAALELQTIDISAQEYAVIHSECNNDIMSIYTAAAHETLRHLYDDPTGVFRLADGTAAGWDLFWIRYSDDMTDCKIRPNTSVPGFGCYGQLGEDYGNTTVDLDGVRHEIDPEEYKGLHRWVLRKQIIDSLKTLLAIDSLRPTKGQ